MLGSCAAISAASAVGSTLVCGNSTEPAYVQPCAGISVARELPSSAPSEELVYSTDTRGVVLPRMSFVTKNNASGSFAAILDCEKTYFSTGANSLKSALTQNIGTFAAVITGVAAMQLV